jgi:hypothetical protein
MNRKTTESQIFQKKRKEEKTEAQVGVVAPQPTALIGRMFQ